MADEDFRTLKKDCLKLCESPISCFESVKEFHCFLKSFGGVNILTVKTVAFLPVSGFSRKTGKGVSFFRYFE